MSTRCPICGEPTSSYMGRERKDRLCRKHAAEFKDGKIVQCEKCGSWHLVGKSCDCSLKYKELPTEGFKECILCGTPTNGYAFCKDCWQQYSTEELVELLNNNVKKKSKKLPTTVKTNDFVVVNDNSKSKCITCGRQTDGLLFCSSCYYKYKDKDLLFKITNCTNIELLDADYEGRYTCKDGHIVKSKSERDIDNYLFENRIRHAYEKELPYGASDKEILHPDFCLPDYLGPNKHVYIEHWGYNENNIQYTKTKKFKMPIYKKLCKEKIMTLICTYEKTDMGKIDTVLDRKLNKAFIKENQVNFEE